MSLVPAQANIVPAQYPASAPQPQWIQGVMSAVVAMVMLSVWVAWGVSQIRKAFRGEEIQKPF